MANLHCVLTSPEALVFEGTVRSVVVPATDGEMGILPNHAALIGTLAFGELRVVTEDGQKSRYFVHGGGFVEVLKNRVTVLAKSVQEVEQIDRADAERELQDISSESVPPGDWQARANHQESLEVAKRRLKLTT